MASENERKLAQAVEHLDRVRLAELPTTLEPMPRLTAALGGPPLYIKRDDLTGLGFGGNKTRMLEFSLADALAKGAEVIVTGAAVQSNYCRQTAAACAKLGLDLHLILRPERGIDLEEVQGNHLLQRLFGAHVRILPDNDRQKQQSAIKEEVNRLQRAGRNVYVPRQPDTVDLDAIAYAKSALELVEQCRNLEIEPQYLYVAAFDTTQAGLVLGLRYMRSVMNVRGISPFQDTPGRFQSMARIANQAAERLDLEISLTEADFDNDNGFVGERYGVPTEAGLEAVRLVAQTEGILLDPVYTGKAMSALIAHIEQGELGNVNPVVFLHTGGAPAIFAYAADVLGAASDDLAL